MATDEKSSTAGQDASALKAPFRPQMTTTKHSNGGSSSCDESVFSEQKHLEAGHGTDINPSTNLPYKLDDNDPNVHEHMNPRLFLSLTAMSFLWIGSQIPLYLYGSVIVYIYSDVGGANGVFVWLVIGYLIANAALCPFVGALSDLFGRKAIAIASQALLCIGTILISTSQNIYQAIGGMVISGIGGGINELVALSGTSEMVSPRKRALYVAAVSLTILPLCPSVLWANLITQRSNWRWVGALVGIWNFIGLILVAVCYSEPRKFRQPRMEILCRVDFLGGLLSISGVVCFLVGMQFGVQQYSWTSAHVLAPLLIGLALIAAFFVWECVFAPYPMVPKELFSKDRRTMIAVLIVMFFSGGNYTATILFWPPQSYKVYGEGYVANGLRGLPIGLGTILGAFLGLVSVSLTRGRTRLLLVFWAVIMTAFTGAISVGTRDNLPIVLAMVTLASIGSGAVVLPASIIAQIVAPTELIGTITAITLSLRHIGGCVAFTAYFNIFYAKYYPLANRVGFEVALQGISGDYHTVFNLVTLASYTQYDQLRAFIADSPLVMQKDIAFDFIVSRVETAFASAYRWPYWMSIAFGGTCIVAACFMRDVRKVYGG